MNDGSGLKYFLTDHLGSVVAITDATGALISQQRYLPFGAERTNIGAISQTDYGYTGQRDLDPGMGGLMDYKARFYSPYLNHFIQPDTIIPDPSNPQAWNRFGYVHDNPINFNDPTGHDPVYPRGMDGWAIILSVDLATSGIPQNTNKAQYTYTETGVLLSEKTGFAMNYNLCGDISLSIVLEAETGMINTLPQIYAAHPAGRTWNGDNGGLGAAEVAFEMAGSFPPGWVATSYSYSEVVVYQSGSTSPVSSNGNALNSPSYWTETDFYFNLIRMLAAGDYVLAGVRQHTSGDYRLTNHLDANGVPHWVLITGMSDTSVSIINPFNNRREIYSRSEFYQSWGHGLVDIAPPNRHPRQVKSKAIAI